MSIASFKETSAHVEELCGKGFSDLESISS